MSAALYIQEQIDSGAVCQRWRDRRHSWRPTHEGGFDPARYRVRELPKEEVGSAKQFVLAHHYSGAWPPVRFAYGLFDTAANTKGGVLVGVLTLGIPMHVGVLKGPFNRLEPYVESLELNRLVLLDEVFANAETWFQARAFRLAAARNVLGIVAHSDPEPRQRITPTGPELVHPGHYGTIYQAKGMEYLGRTSPRRLHVLPDASILTDRAIAKVCAAGRAAGRGHGGVEQRLVAFGARPRSPGEPGRPWLDEALHAIGATVMHHGGNHRYRAWIGPRGRRDRRGTLTAFPYPKKHEQVEPRLPPL
jgi:hypothetical protein